MFIGDAKVGDFITFETHDLVGVTRVEIRPGLFQSEPVTVATRHAGMITEYVRGWNGNTPKITFVVGGKRFDTRPDFMVESL